MRQIDKIIIHCTATQEGRDYSVDDVRRGHLARGWSDIGYHYLIRLDGTIERGRPVSKIGAHCRGQNRNSIGICYVGGCDEDMKPKDTRTTEQREALNNLLLELKTVYPLATIHGHNEFSSKACPSFNVQTEL